MRWCTEIVLPGLSLSSHAHRDPLFKAAKCVLYLPGCVGTREIERASIEVDLVPGTRPLLRLVSIELEHGAKEAVVVRAPARTLSLQHEGHCVAQSRSLGLCRMKTKMPSIPTRCCGHGDD